MLEVDALPQRAALSRAVEADHGEAEIGQRQQKRVELLDERIVAAMEDEGAELLPLRLQAKARQVPARIGNRDALVPSTPFMPSAQVRVKSS